MAVVLRFMYSNYLWMNLESLNIIIDKKRVMYDTCCRSEVTVSIEISI